MMINKEVTKNRSLSSSEELTISSPMPTVSRYLWKAEGDSYLPYLLVDEGIGQSHAIRLEGELFLSFGQKHCLDCGTIIPWQNRQALCEACQESLSFLCRRCIFEGPGQPFGATCSPEEPACGLQYQAARCWSNHFVYIGQFGRLFKVGISSCSRKEGQYYRLIEQGLEGAIILKGFNSLARALQVEAKLSDYLNLRTALTFQQKVEEIVFGKEEKESFNWHALAEEILALYPKITVSYLDLSTIWPILEQDFTAKIIHRVTKLSGEPVYSRGNVLIIKSIEQGQEEYLAYNLSYLSGYQLISPEQYDSSLLIEKKPPNHLKESKK